MRHPDWEKMTEFMDQSGIPEWVEEPIIRGLDPSSFPEPYFELASSQSAREEMVSFLQF